MLAFCLRLCAWMARQRWIPSTCVAESTNAEALHSNWFIIHPAQQVTMQINKNRSQSGSLAPMHLGIRYRSCATSKGVRGLRQRS